MVDGPGASIPVKGARTVAAPITGEAVKRETAPALSTVVKYGIKMIGRDWKCNTVDLLQEFLMPKGVLQTDRMTKKSFEELVGLTGNGLDQFWAKYAGADGTVSVEKLGKMMEDLYKTSEATQKPLSLLMQAKDITFVSAGAFSDWFNGLSEKQQLEMIGKYPQINELVASKMRFSPADPMERSPKQVLKDMKGLTPDKLDLILFGLFDGTFCEDMRRSGGSMPQGLTGKFEAKYFLAAAYNKYVFGHEKVVEELGSPELDSKFMDEIHANLEKLATLRAGLEKGGSLLGLMALDKMEPGKMGAAEFQARFDAIYTSFEKGTDLAKVAADLMQLANQTASLPRRDTPSLEPAAAMPVSIGRERRPLEPARP